MPHISSIDFAYRLTYTVDFDELKRGWRFSPYTLACFLTHEFTLNDQPPKAVGQRYPTITLINLTILQLNRIIKPCFFGCKRFGTPRLSKTIFCMKFKIILFYHCVRRRVKKSLATNAPGFRSRLLRCRTRQERHCRNRRLLASS